MAYQDSYKSEPIYPLASGGTIVSGRRHSCASGTLTPPAATANGHFSVVNTGAAPITITGLGVVDVADEGRWVAAGATWRRIGPDDGGMYIGAGATYATLPLTNTTRAAMGNDFAILTADEVGTGTAANPQFPRGVYRFDGSNYQLSARLTSPVTVDGVYMGQSATFAGLPTTRNGHAAVADDWALLSVQSGANTPGIYRYTGASYVQVMEIISFNAARLGGRWMGLSATFAGLPANNGLDAAVEGDWAYLSADNVGTGTVAAPQYPRGVYRRTSGAWAYSVTISQTGVVTHTGTPANPTVPSQPAIAINTTTSQVSHYWLPASNAWLAIAAAVPVGGRVQASSVIASAQISTQITIGELQMRYSSSDNTGNLEVRMSGTGGGSISYTSSRQASNVVNYGGASTAINNNSGAFTVLGAGGLGLNVNMRYVIYTTTSAYEVLLANRADQRIFLSAVQFG